MVFITTSTNLTKLLHISSTVLLNSSFVVNITDILDTPVSSMQFSPSHTKCMRHLKPQSPVHSNVPVGIGLALQLVHMVLAVAVHCLPMKVPFGHCAVHGVQFLPLFSRNVFFVQVNEHWFVQLKGPVTGVLQSMHLEIPSSEHGDENMPGTKH
jgi:hypothetical protein